MTKLSNTIKVDVAINDKTFGPYIMASLVKVCDQYTIVDFDGKYIGAVSEFNDGYHLIHYKKYFDEPSREDAILELCL